MLEEPRFSVANPKFRDALMREQVDRGQDTSELCLDLKGWRDATADGELVAAGKKALTDALRARLRARRSGSARE